MHLDVKWLALALLMAGPARAQGTTTQDLEVPLDSGTLTIQNVGPTTHSFNSLTLTGTTRSNVALTLPEPPVFSISNPGTTSGWSVTLSATQTDQKLTLDYAPGGGTVSRTSGDRATGDLTVDSTAGGNALSTGIKVLSAPAGTNYGVFQYSMSSSGWTVSSIPANVAPGNYVWTITATVSNTP